MKKTRFLPYLSVCMGIVFIGCSTNVQTVALPSQPLTQEDHPAVPAEYDRKVLNDSPQQTTLIKVKEISKNSKKVELKKSEKPKNNDEKEEEDKELTPESTKTSGSNAVSLLKVGPQGWTVLDLSKGFSTGRLKKADVIARIREEKMVYRVFTYDEIQKLLSYKIPYKVINAMMYTAQQPQKNQNNEPAPQFPKINYLRN